MVDCEDFVFEEEEEEEDVPSFGGRMILGVTSVRDIIVVCCPEGLISFWNI